MPAISIATNKKQQDMPVAFYKMSLLWTVKEH